MKPLTCAATRRRLEAFYDEELSVREQIAVSAHLDWCDDCSAAAAGLRLLGAALRVAAPGRAVLAASEPDGLAVSSLLNRLKAERALPWLPRLELLCEDLHLVSAGFGASVAALVCVLSLAGMMKLTAAERPDSLAGIVSVQAIRLECEPADIGAVSECRHRFGERFQRSAESAEEEAVFALDAAVVSEGRLETLDSLRARPHEQAAGQARRIEELIDTVARARFETRAVPGVLWLVTDTTVRASMPPAAPPPVERKRAVLQAANPATT